MIQELEKQSPGGCEGCSEESEVLNLCLFWLFFIYFVLFWFWFWFCNSIWSSVYPGVHPPPHWVAVARPNVAQRR